MCEPAAYKSLVLRADTPAVKGAAHKLLKRSSVGAAKLRTCVPPRDSDRSKGRAPSMKGAAHKLLKRSSAGAA